MPRFLFVIVFLLGLVGSPRGDQSQDYPPEDASASEVARPVEPATDIWRWVTDMPLTTWENVNSLTSPQSRSFPCEKRPGWLGRIARWRPWRKQQAGR